MPPRRFPRRPLAVAGLVVAGVVAAVGLLLVPAVQRVRTAAQRSADT